MLSNNTSSSKFKHFVLILFTLMLLFQFTESLSCCYNNVNEAKCAKTCTGERCMKLLSPGGKTIRRCINGRDPDFDFVGHRHNDEGEDAYICSNEDHCNSASIPFIYGTVLLPVIIHLFTYILH